MYICFVCSSSFATIDQLILHLRHYHNLGTQSVFHCKQLECVSHFQGSKQFRQHLNRVHFVPNINPRLLNNINIPNKNLNTISPVVLNLKESQVSKAVEITEEFGLNDYFENMVRSSALKFITSLNTKPNVTSSLMQEIVERTTELFSSGIISHLKSKIEPYLTNCDNSRLIEIQNMFNILENPFSKLKTEYQRIKYFESNNVFFKPKTIVLGFTKETKIVSGVERQVMVPVQGHLFSIKENLKHFFELPGVFDVAYQYTVSSSNNSNLSSFLNGSTWKNIMTNFPDKIVFPIYLYYDDAEMGNPLGSHSGVHKIGCVYYTIPALPPEYLSSLENIFPAYLFHSSDRGAHKFDNKTMFSALINVLIDLQENGTTIVVNSISIKIYFVLGLILGDNLGLNSMLGFVQSFSANYYCRICRSHKHDLQTMLKESVESIRNKNNYESDITTANVSETGINECCAFNKIPNYHVTVNSVCDFMHDVSEGVARYDMAVIINCLINHEYFSLEDLNQRILLFEYGMTESKNIPPPISQNHLKNNSIIMSASEMLCLVRYFGLIVGELIPLETEIWKLYLYLRKIIDICCARVLQPECATLLDNLISEHNRLYLKFSNSLLKPKFHILTHYGRLLLQNGPINLTSSLRFEAKHKVLKAYSNSIPCRINLGHTLSHKLQLQMVDRLLTQRGLQPDLKVGSCVKINTSIEFSQCVFDSLPTEFKLDTVLVSSIEYKGVTYKPGMLVIVDINLNGCIFGKIMNILINNSRTPYLVYALYLTVGFDDHFHAYEIKKYDDRELNISSCYVKDLSDFTPTVSRILGNGKLYATLRYAL